MSSPVQTGSVCNALPSPNDPIRRLTRSLRLTWFFGCTIVALCALWAWQPHEPNERSEIPLDLHPATLPLIDDEQQRIDQIAFIARLWNPPPEARDARMAAQTIPTPKPLRFQLIGITDDGRQLRAALYDPDTDRLLIVGTGDHLKRHTVTITPDAVELADGQVTHRLALRKDGS